MSDDENRDPENGSNPLDLSAWEPQLPPADFASKVLAAVRPPVVVARKRRWLLPSIGAVAIAAAILVEIGVRSNHDVGEAIAKDRIEVPIGHRALAVLEPGAKVQWNGDDVVQSTGDVFYRVEPGAKFTVHTPAGDVEVRGTCFSVKVRDMQKRDVKVAAITTALSALAFVAVYEGKVAVSHASERVELTSGETAQTGPNGVRKTNGAAALDTSTPDEQTNEPVDPTMSANANLVHQIGDYRSRLEHLASEKSELETKLGKTEAALSAAQDGAPVKLKHDFDLDSDDWKELAKKGSVKFQTPCPGTKDGWTPSPAALDKLGLAPQDAAPIHAAYQKSTARIWSQIKPICAAEVGNAELAEKLGSDTCMMVIGQLESERDSEAMKRAVSLVGQIRSGEAPMPGPSAELNPATKMYLAMTGESKAFENDLAQSFGPEEARRLVYSDQLCMGHHQSTYGSPSSPTK